MTTPCDECGAPATNDVQTCGQSGTTTISLCKSCCNMHWKCVRGLVSTGRMDYRISGVGVMQHRPDWDALVERGTRERQEALAERNRELQKPPRP